MEYFLNEVSTLEEIYKDVYSQKDFNMALDGLKRFDEENGYDIFADDGFLTEIEEMAAMIPDEDSKNDEGEEDEAPKKTKSTSKSKKVEEPETDEEKPDPVKNLASSPAKEKAAKVASYPPLSKMKKFLEEYIGEEYPEAELPDDLTIAEVRSWYDLAQAGEALPFPEEDETSTETASEPENKEEPKEESPIDENATDKDEELLKAKARLQALKDKMKKK